MSRVQPQIKKMQAEYKDDRQKLNEEMMKFYKQEGINPAAGCFPLLLQLPVFFGLFRVIRGLVLNRPAFVLRPYGSPSRTISAKNSEMYRAIVRSGGQLLSWGFDLAQSASGTWGSSKATPYLILVLAVRCQRLGPTKHGEQAQHDAGHGHCRPNATDHEDLPALHGAVRLEHAGRTRRVLVCIEPLDDRPARSASPHDPSPRRRTRSIDVKDEKSADKVVDKTPSESFFARPLR